MHEYTIIKSMTKKIRNPASKTTSAKHTRPRVSFASRTVLPSRPSPIDPIFHEDSDEDTPKEAISHRLRLRPRRPRAVSFLPMVKMEEEQFFPDYNQDSNYQLERPRRFESPIFFSSDYPWTSEIDFKIFADSAARTKLFSVMLVDHYGRIIFSDKLGHELFEGSLNNFNTIKIQNLLLRTLKDSFLDQLKDIQDFNQWTTVNWIIYSKNTKRRYSRVPFNRTNALDTYYRFLKALTIRIRPAKMVLSNCTAIEGFWNPALIPAGERELFLLETRLCSRMPPLALSAMWNDALLAKYIKSNAKKAREWAIEVGITAQLEGQTNESPLSQPNDDYGQSSTVRSQSFSQVSFSDPEVGKCKIEQPMSEEVEVQAVKEEEKVEKVKVEKEGVVKVKRAGRGVGLFAEISIDDI